MTYYNPDLILTEAFSAEEERNYTGSFCGFVLLDNESYSFLQLRERLQQWEIAPLADSFLDDAMMTDTDLIFEVPGAMITVSLMKEPIPDGEAEAAALHALWQDAQSVVKAHTAHLMIAVLPRELHAMDAGRLYSRMVSACLDDPHAKAVYTSGTILSPEAFQKETTYMTPDSLPIRNLIYVGTYQCEGGNCGYTVGMDAFGRDELEVLDSALSKETIAHYLYQIAALLLSEQQPAQWYFTVSVNGLEWEARRKDGVMVEGHSMQLQHKL